MRVTVAIIGILICACFFRYFDNKLQKERKKELYHVGTLIWQKGYLSGAIAIIKSMPRDSSGTVFLRTYRADSVAASVQIRKLW